MSDRRNSKPRAEPAKSDRHEPLPSNPKSGHCGQRSVCPLSAKSGHRNKLCLFAISMTYQLTKPSKAAADARWKAAIGH